MLRFALPALVFGLVGAPFNELREMSPAELLRAADLVTVATPVDCSPLGDRDDEAGCDFRTIATVKGEVLKQFHLRRTNGISEMSIYGCCEKGHSYLMYVHFWRGAYYSVNGVYGVKDVTPAPTS